MQLLNIQEAAERLGVSVRTIYRLFDERKLPRVKIRGCARVRADDLNRYVERNTESRVYGDADYPRINYVPGMKVV